MKKITTLLFTAMVCTSVVLSVENPSTVAQTNNVKNSQMHLLEFTDEDRKFTLLAPPGAKVIKESWGGIKIQAGERFNIELSISDETIYNRDSLAAVKKEIRNNDVNILKRVITETPTSILFESAFISTQPEFHLYVYKELDDRRLICENAKGTAFSESEAMLMWQSCNSIDKKLPSKPLYKT